MKKMRVLVTGALGLLGNKVREVLLRETDWDIILMTRSELIGGGDRGVMSFDPMDRSQWKSVVLSNEWRPDVIVNTAAYSVVDACETDREEAWKSNVRLVEIMAEVCRKTDAKLIQISTDYVFDGKHGPYNEEAIPNPINYYGRTKLAAENVCRNGRIDYAIIRTMWLYGEMVQGKMSFVDWVLKQLNLYGSAPVVTDEVGNLTYTGDVAMGIVKVIENSFTGTVNIAGADTESRHWVAQQIAESFGFDPKSIRRITSDSLHRPAPRPLNSGLVTLKARMALDFKPIDTKTGLSIYKVMKNRKLESDRSSFRKYYKTR